MIRIFISILFVFILLDCYSQTSGNEKSDESVIELLEMENDLLVFSINSDSLTNIYNSWKTQYDKNCQFDSTFSINKLTKYIFTELNIQFDNNSILFSDIIKYRRGNCVTISLLYLLLANEDYDTMCTVNAPSHHFIRAYDNLRLNYVNIEPTKNGESYSDEYIIGHKGIPVETITQGVYMNEGNYAYLVNSYKQNIASILSIQGKLDEAIALFNMVIEYDSISPEAYNNRGDCYYAKKELELALSDYKEAIKLNPYFHRFYFSLANTYSNLGMDRNAIVNYDLAIKYYDGYSEYFLNRGIAYANCNDLYNACKDLSKSSDMNNEKAKKYLLSVCK